MFAERLKSVLLTSQEVLALALAYWLATGCIKINEQTTHGFTVDIDSLERLRGRELTVGEKLFTLLQPANIPLHYEHYLIKRLQAPKGKKFKTCPDFHFFYQDRDFFIEVGTACNNESHKNEQLGVVRHGIEEGGPIPSLLYVQLDDGDIAELLTIKSLPELMDYLLERERLVKFMRRR